MLIPIVPNLAGNRIAPTPRHKGKFPVAAGDEPGIQPLEEDPDKIRACRELTNNGQARAKP